VWRSDLSSSPAGWRTRQRRAGGVVAAGEQAGEISGVHVAFEAKLGFRGTQPPASLGALIRVVVAGAGNCRGSNRSAAVDGGGSR